MIKEESSFRPSEKTEARHTEIHTEMIYMRTAPAIRGLITEPTMTTGRQDTGNLREPPIREVQKRAAVLTEGIPHIQGEAPKVQPQGGGPREEGDET